LTYDICHDLPKLYEKFMDDAIGTGKFYLSDPADPTIDLTIWFLLA